MNDTEAKDTAIGTRNANKTVMEKEKAKPEHVNNQIKPQVEK